MTAIDNKEIVRGSRKARVDHSVVNSSGEFGVFKHTFYMGRWYYDGCVEFPTYKEAVAYRDEWIGE